MKILVINSGSSSIKYQLFEMTTRSALVTGILEEIGRPTSRLKHRKSNDKGEYTEYLHNQPVADHHQGLQLIMEFFSHPEKGWDLGDLAGIGHRVVHGGEAFRDPTIINEAVIDTIKQMAVLAPLHNPANLVGIEAAREFFPLVQQVAVFDTAFHQTMPAHAFRYALPHELYTRHHVRRYGFHGTSHRYVAKQAAVELKTPLEKLNMITLHLGNGASATAIRAGESIDTSMGMTPLEGLIMGTRCGDLDPAIQGYLVRAMKESSEEVESIFEHQSGLLGICGTSDMREVVRGASLGNDRASLAVRMFCYRIKKYIGAYYAILGKVDALIFTGGIGENSPEVRAGCCQGLESMGIELDEERNQTPWKGTSEIQSDGSTVKILIVPTNEELEIALQTAMSVSG